MLTPDAADMRDVPSEYAQWSLSDYSGGLHERIEPFLGGQAWALVLAGSVGSRKSSVAAAVLRQWRATGHTSSGPQRWGEWISSDKLRRAMLDFENGRGKLEYWRERPILVLDDIGACRTTPHAVETLVHLVDSRYGQRLATIATTNGTLPELGELVDMRIASRLSQGIMLDLGEHDWRQTTEKEISNGEA